MNSYRRHDAPRARRHLTIATILVVLLACIDMFSHGYIRYLTRTVVSQAWSATDSAVLHVLHMEVFTSRKALIQENELLRTQLARMQEQAIAYTALEDENHALREIARVASSEQGITAPVTSSFYASPYGTFLIGAGSADGIARGDMVLAGETGFLIGRVVHTDAHRAVVVELFAPGAKFDAVINGISVELEGRGGGNAHANVPRDSVIASGDLVRVRQYGDRVAGVVGGVEVGPASAYQDVYVALPISRSSISFVYVVSQ